MERHQYATERVVHFVKLMSTTKKGTCAHKRYRQQANSWLGFIELHNHLNGK